MRALCQCHFFFLFARCVEIDFRASRWNFVSDSYSKYALQTELRNQDLQTTHGTKSNVVKATRITMQKIMHNDGTTLAQLFGEGLVMWIREIAGLHNWKDDDDAFEKNSWRRSGRGSGSHDGRGAIPSHVFN